jgi:hypothetical protein
LSCTAKFQLSKVTAPTQRLMLAMEGFKIFVIQWFGVTFVGSHRLLT